jgi:hypothetical protein
MSSIVQSECDAERFASVAAADGNAIGRAT